MRLGTKTALSITLTLAALVGVVLLVSSKVIVDGFRTLERDVTTNNVRRAVNAVHQAADRLAVKTADWAAWDDTYAFIEDRNESYEHSNLQPDSFATLRLSWVAYLNQGGQIVWAKAIARSGEAFEPVPPDVAALLETPDLVTRPDSDGVHGVLRLGNARYIVASHQITTTDRSAPPRGTLIFAERLDNIAVDGLSALIEVRMSIIDRTELERAGRLSALEIAQLDRNVPVASPTDDAVIAGFAQIYDIYDRPGLIARVQIPRDIYLKGRQAATFLIAAVALAGLVFTIVTVAILRRVVISRIVHLDDEVRGVASGTRVGARVTASGADELASLAESINSMLQTIETRAAELEQARSGAEAASRTKSDFLANMSHEIRTPMTGILGYADLLGDESISSDQRADCVQTIRRNGEHLLQIINDILDVSKIEAGKLEPDMTRCVLRSLVDEAVALVKVSAANKSLALNIDFHEPLPETIVTDPLRLRQIIVNLLSNAIKFTQHGSVTLTVGPLDAVHAGRGGWPTLLFTVVDTGIGMTPDQLARLFKPFSQADSSMSRRFGGTGLGLTISKRLAAILGGDLVAASTPGIGSTFTLHIDPGPSIAKRTEAPAAAEPLQLAKTPASGPPLKGVRVLLAEDGADNQRLIGFHLKKAGARVEFADNGRAAVEIARAAAEASAHHDLILMDMQMPILDGYGAAAELRHSGWPGPIIALTAHAMSGDREKCLAAGCSDYLTKPVDPAALVATCLRALDNRPDRAAA